MNIALVIAMEQELQFIKSNLSGIVSETLFPSAELFRGSYAGHSVRLIKTGIGKANAAALCSALLALEPADLVVNTGLAGALRSDLRPSDIVVADRFLYHDVDATEFGYPLGTVPNMPDSYDADAAFRSDLLACAREKRGDRAFSGTVATGDSFVGKEELTARIRVFTGASLVDMEAASIAQTCFLHGAPFVSVKTVSDNSDSEAAAEFYNNILEKCEISGSIVLDFLKNLNREATK